MSAKKSDSQIKEDIKDRGFLFLGDVPTTGVRHGRFQCSKGHIWEATIVSVTNSGNGCSECARKKAQTYESINGRLKPRGYTMVSGYTNTNHKALFRCPVGHEWPASVGNVLAGSNCAKCAANQFLTKEIVNKRIAHMGIILIGEYKGTKTKTLFRCSNGHDFFGTPGDRLGGDGCAVCSGNIPLTPEIINERLAPRRIIMFDGYTAPLKHAMFRCEFGHEWKAFPNGVLMGNGCSICSGRCPEQAKMDFYKNAEKRNHKVVGDYNGSKPPVGMECPKGHVFKIAPADFRLGRGCSICSGRGFKISEPGFFYLYKLVQNGKSFLGFGITYNFKQRDKVHRTELKKAQIRWEVLGVYGFDTGARAKSIEDEVKLNYKSINLGVLGFKRECTSLEFLEEITRLASSEGTKIKWPPISRRP